MVCIGSPEKIPEFKFKGRNLTDEECGFLLDILKIVKSNSEAEVPVCVDKHIGDTFFAKMFLKRIKAYKLPFMVSNMFFAMSVATWVKNPGKVMMLLRVVYQQWKKSGKIYFTLEDWSFELFPAVPTDDEQRDWWESQKSQNQPMGCDNMVDNLNYWR